MKIMCDKIFLRKIVRGEVTENMDNKKLGERIRFHRKLLNLSQKELAERLYVTPQNLSKWEKGLSNPDIWNLCRIAEVLDLSCDYLLGIGAIRENKKVFLAVDGGATKTEFLLFNEAGDILKRMVLSGTNPNACGMDKALEVLKEGMDSMISACGTISTAFMGIAGCGNQKNKKSVQEFLEKNYYGIEFDVRSDIYNVVYTEEPAENYIAVVCGTGSAVAVKVQDEIYGIGGYGYIFDDAYCGFTLGKEALKATMKYENGIGEKTILTDIVETIMGGRVLDNINTIYKAGKDYIASFAPVVFEAFDKGDAASQKIIDKSILELADLINSAMQKYEISKEVVLSGGVASRKDIIIPYLEKYCPGVNFAVTELPQIYGAAIYCRKKMGDADNEFKMNLKKQYKIYVEGEKKNA